MRRNLLQVMVQMTKPQKEWLKQESDRLGISMAELVRRIIDDYRGEGPNQWKSTEPTRSN